MDKATALRVSETAQEALGQLDLSIHAVQAASAQPEFETFRTVVGKIMGAIVVEVLQPLYAEHPDIVPEELK